MYIGPGSVGAVQDRHHPVSFLFLFDPCEDRLPPVDERIIQTWNTRLEWKAG